MSNASVETAGDGRPSAASPPFSWPLGLLLVALVVAAFAPALLAGFIWDDEGRVVVRSTEDRQFSERAGHANRELRLARYEVEGAEVDRGTYLARRERLHLGAEEALEDGRRWRATATARPTSWPSEG